MPATGLPLRVTSITLKPICRQCSHHSSRRVFSRTSISQSAAVATSRERLRTTYFQPRDGLDRLAGFRKPKITSNEVTERVEADKVVNAQSVPTQVIGERDLPHRRRQEGRRRAAAAQASTREDAPTSADLPNNASSTLTTLSASQPTHSFRRTASALLALSKPRLTVLVVLSAMAPYALYPTPAFLSAAAADIAAPSLSPLTLLFLTTGTTLCSASANALNMLYEPKTDALMSRTRNRPLVRGDLVSTRMAAAFAITAGLLGIGLLYVGVNPTVSSLGGANIFLYAGIYTPLKAVSWLNTWIGAIVGGIPPLMGWAAAAGESATGDGSWRELLFTFPAPADIAVTSSAGGWLLAALLFAWQFPHFMALSWPVREEYKAAGLKMLSWVNPARNARVALRYSLAFVPICVGLCTVGVTEWSFAVTSLPVNYWLAREAIKFWRFEGHKGSARGLFWASVWHLPVVMVLALVQKKGLWARVWTSMFGQPVDEDEELEWEEEPEVELIPIPIPVQKTRA